MTQPPTHRSRESKAGPSAWRTGRHLLSAGLVLCLCGCIGNPMTLFKQAKKPDEAPQTGEGLVLRGGKLEPDARPAEGTAAADILAGKEFLRQAQHVDNKDVQKAAVERQELYVKAERLFHKVAGNEKNMLAIAEEARYYEGECLRLQARYPKALSTYNKLLKDFPSGTYHRDACQRIFDIANYWLDETRDQMEARAKSGKDAHSWPLTYVHWEKTKPLLDMQGHALEALEQVYLNDPTGELGAKALWYIGTVRFFLEEYREADHYFNQLYTNFPNGPYAAKALEYTIICKQLSTGGIDYDGRRLADARRLVHTALNAYPELKDKRGDFLERQLATINLQQAAKDFSVAEFYQRVGRSGSAYFYYEVVRRRYPGTKYAEEAQRRMTVLEERAKIQQQRREAGMNLGGVKLWPFAPKSEGPQQPAGPRPVLPGQAPPVPPTPGTPLQPEGLPQPRVLPDLPGASSINGPQQ